MNFRNRNTPTKSASAPGGGEMLTQQNFKNDADINTMVNRHLKGIGKNLSNIGNTGMPRQPIFGDFSQKSYHDMLNAVTDIRGQFGQLSPRIRTRFQGDPGLLLRFLEDPANLKEAIKLGLCTIPDGYMATPEGNIIEQIDLGKEAPKGPVTPEAPKADPEANPDFKGGKK